MPENALTSKKISIEELQNDDVLTMFSRGVKSKPKTQSVKKFSLPSTWLDNTQTDSTLNENVSTGLQTQDVISKDQSSVNIKRSGQLNPDESKNAQQSTPQTKSKQTGSQLSQMLNKVKNQNKISSIDKSRQEWEAFAKHEKIESELEANKKDGYLQELTFLHETDLRQFDLEKEVRNRERKKRK